MKLKYTVAYDPCGLSGELGPVRYDSIISIPYLEWHSLANAQLFPTTVLSLEQLGTMTRQHKTAILKLTMPSVKLKKFEAYANEEY